MSELVLLGVLSATITVGLLAVRAAYNFAESRNRRVLELTFPREFTIDDAEAVVRGLAGLLGPWWRRLIARPTVVAEVWADANGIRHLLRVPSRLAPYVSSQLWASGVRLGEPSAARPTPPALSGAAEFRRQSAQLEVRQPEPIAAGILAALQPLAAGERVVLQWIITPASGPEARSAALTAEDAWWQSLEARRGSQPSSRDWQSEPAFLTALRVGVAAGSSLRSRQLLGQLAAALHRSRGALPTFRRRLLPDGLVARRLLEGQVPLTTYPALVRASELAALLAFPLGGPSLPGLHLARTRQLAPAPDLPKEGRVLGVATFPGLQRRIALERPRALLTHQWVCGPTGTGKSTLLLRCVLDDIAAGSGACVVDPKGDLCRELLARIPASRADDVIVLDPSDAEHPVGLNLLRASGGSPELAADGVLHIFRHLARSIWAGSWGPRLEDLLRGSLLTLARTPGMTLCELPQLLVDPGFRLRALARLDDPLGLEPFWAAFDALPDGERAQALAPLMNKVRAFTVIPRIRNVIGQAEQTFSLEEVLADGRILLVNLPKGQLGEGASRLLGAAVLAQLWQAVLGRAALPPERRHPFYVYVDEFQDLVALPVSLGDALAQSRAMGVGFVLANQFSAQLPAELRAGALSNARSKVLFQLAAADAAVFARELAPFVTASDLQGLEPFEAIVSPAVGAGVGSPVTIRTLPAPPLTEQPENVRRRSRERYGRPRAQVEADIAARAAGPRRHAPVGARRRP